MKKTAPKPLKPTSAKSKAPAQKAGAFDVSRLDACAFRAELLRWYAANARDLPWRRTFDPYQVWISEIMLQQTQMDRAVEYFARWMRRFPDVAELASASEDEVLKLWEGLGYYSRARNLRRAAAVIAERFGGRFPDSHEDVRALPGVGPYTAGAIMSVAYNASRPAVDANVERVFARLFDIAEPLAGPRVKRAIVDAAWALVPADDARSFNQAMMELGALVCAPRSPRCPACPVARHCLARARGTEQNRPLPAPKPEIIRIDMASGVLAHKGRVFIQKRRPDDVWPGLWEFPGGVMEAGESPEEALVREYREETELVVLPAEKLAVVRYSYTRYRITLHGFLCGPAPGQEPLAERLRLNEAVEGRFVTLDELSAFAFPSGHARLVALLRQDPRFAALCAGTE